MIRLISFGYRQKTSGGLHLFPPVADFTIDARRMFQNPITDPRFKQLTGFDEEVMEHVVTTKGVLTVIRNHIELVSQLHFAGHNIRLAAGCSGGRHRSVAIIRRIEMGLHGCGVQPKHIDTVHRDVGRHRRRCHISPDEREADNPAYQHRP